MKPQESDRVAKCWRMWGVFWNSRQEEVWGTVRPGTLGGEVVMMGEGRKGTMQEEVGGVVRASTRKAL